MEVLGHEDAGRDGERVFPADLFEDLLDGVLGLGGVEERLTLVTTEGEEVGLTGVLVAFESVGHGEKCS
jgi:hypothetical protein